MDLKILTFNHNLDDRASSPTQTKFQIPPSHPMVAESTACPGIALVDSRRIGFVKNIAAML